MRRLLLGVSLGFAIGAFLVVILDPETRKRLWDEVARESKVVREKVEEIYKLLNQAVEAGKEGAKLREKELRGKVSSRELEEEPPNYIV